MNKVNILVLLLAGMLCSCVSQKKYNKLISENERIRSNYSILELEKDYAESIHVEWIRRYSERNKKLKKKNIILEREVNKYIRIDNGKSSECMPKANDSIGVYITFFSLDSASSSTEAMTLAYRKVEDSVKIVCEDIIFEAIKRYSDATKEPLDTIDIDGVLQKTTQYVCNDVWKDSQDTYWAIEVQRVYWSDFINNYIAKISGADDYDEEQIAEIENGIKNGEYDNKFMRGLLEHMKQIANRKRNKELLKDILEKTILDKTTNEVSRKAISE